MMQIVLNGFLRNTNLASMGRCLRYARVLACGLLCAFLMAGFARADYPNRTLTLVVPSPPGGSTDTIARVLGETLGKRLGQAVVIENKSGAGGIVGTSYVLDRPADGYTMLLAISSKTVVNALQPNLPYRATEDLSSVILLSQVPTVMVTSVASGLSTFSQLKERMRGHPDEVTWGIPGIGTAPHLTKHVLTDALDAKVTEVQYRGSAPMHLDLLAGRVDVVVDSYTALKPHIDSKAVVPVAVIGHSRVDGLPEVQTLGELGIGAFDEVLYVGWNAIDVRADTKPEIVERLNQEIQALLEEEGFLKRITDLGLVPFKPMSAAQSQEFVEEVSRTLSPLASSLAASQ